MSTQYDFGMVGLGTMGNNLLLNIADHGFAAIGYDKDPAKVELLEASATPGTTVKGVFSLQEMTTQLKRPRKIMMLVPAGPIVDSVINEILPLLEEDDILIDGGNSHYTDTARRIIYLQDKKLHFVGMGISGGEIGARLGPSIMPGGDVAAWNFLRPILESISATVNNEPCVAYMGKGPAGHYVKMVHNGIEYAIMQLISEAYGLLKDHAGLTNDELHQVFSKWNEGEMKSFLIEITADIFLMQDEQDKERLIDMILDRAGSKGTGKWTSQDAMDLPVPVPTIDMAVGMRDLSVYKPERVRAAALYKTTVKSFRGDRKKLVAQLHDALYCATVMAYAQGLSMLYQASSILKMEIPLADVVGIWRGGCIIRSSLLGTFRDAYKKEINLPNLLLDKNVARLVKKKESGLRNISRICSAAKIPASGFMSALGYIDAYRTARLPTNLIQAQRDYFGAHGYERTDRPGFFHTVWQELP